MYGILSGFGFGLCALAEKLLDAGGGSRVYVAFRRRARAGTMRTCRRGGYMCLVDVLLACLRARASGVRSVHTYRARIGG